MSIKYMLFYLDSQHNDTFMMPLGQESYYADKPKISQIYVVREMLRFRSD